MIGEFELNTSGLRASGIDKGPLGDSSEVEIVAKIETGMDLGERTWMLLFLIRKFLIWRFSNEFVDSDLTGGGLWIFKFFFFVFFSVSFLYCCQKLKSKKRMGWKRKM